MSPEDKLQIGKRIARARKDAGFSQKDLATALGVTSQSVVSDWENAKLESWREHLTGLARTLHKPKGYFTDTPDETSDQPEMIDSSGDLPPLVSVPEYDVRLSAGGGFVVDQETIRRHWPLPRFLVEDMLGLRPGRVTIQEIIGDSMEPTLHSGDFVLIDLDDRRIGLPGLFAVWDGDALVCKRLERIPGEDRPLVRLKSDNPHHGEYRVPEERVSVVGRVRWVTRRT